MSTRCYQFLEFIRSHQCCLCGDRPAEAHHHARPFETAKGKKVSDLLCVPLCRTHHQFYHHARLDHDDVDKMDAAHVDLLMEFIEVQAPHLFHEDKRKPRKRSAKPAPSAPQCCPICRYPVPTLHRATCPRAMSIGED